jgi:hypothetical protein
MRSFTKKNVPYNESIYHLMYAVDVAFNNLRNGLATPNANIASKNTINLTNIEAVHNLIDVDEVKRAFAALNIPNVQNFATFFVHGNFPNVAFGNEPAQIGGILNVQSPTPANILAVLDDTVQNINNNLDIQSAPHNIANQTISNIATLLVLKQLLRAANVRSEYENNYAFLTASIIDGIAGAIGIILLNRFVLGNKTSVVWAGDNGMGRGAAVPAANYVGHIGKNNDNICILYKGFTPPTGGGNQRCNKIINENFALPTIADARTEVMHAIQVGGISIANDHRVLPVAGHQDGTIILNGSATDILNNYFNTHSDKNYKKSKLPLIKVEGLYCAYCESVITDGRNYDIEHSLPKSVFPTEMLDWENLVVSCKVCNESFKVALFVDTRAKNINADDKVDQIELAGDLYVTPTNRKASVPFHAAAIVNNNVVTGGGDYTTYAFDSTTAYRNDVFIYANAVLPTTNVHARLAAVLTKTVAINPNARTNDAVVAAMRKVLGAVGAFGFDANPMATANSVNISLDGGGVAALENANDVWNQTNIAVANIPGGRARTAATNASNAAEHLLENTLWAKAEAVNNGNNNAGLAKGLAKTVAINPIANDNAAIQAAMGTADAVTAYSVAVAGRVDNAGTLLLTGAAGNLRNASETAVAAIIAAKLAVDARLPNAGDAFAAAKAAFLYTIDAVQHTVGGVISNDDFARITALFAQTVAVNPNAYTNADVVAAVKQVIGTDGAFGFATIEDLNDFLLSQGGSLDGYENAFAVQEVAQETARAVNPADPNATNAANAATNLVVNSPWRKAESVPNGANENAKLAALLAKTVVINPIAHDQAAVSAAFNLAFDHNAFGFANVAAVNTALGAMGVAALNNSVEVAGRAWQAGNDAVNAVANNDTRNARRAAAAACAIATPNSYAKIRDTARDNTIWPDRQYTNIEHINAGQHITSFQAFDYQIQGAPNYAVAIAIALNNLETNTHIHVAANYQMNLQGLGDMRNQDDVRVVMNPHGLVGGAGVNVNNQAGVQQSARNIIDICGLNRIGKNNDARHNDQRVVRRTKAWLHAMKQLKILWEFGTNIKALHDYYSRQLHPVDIMNNVGNDGDAERNNIVNIRDNGTAADPAAVPAVPAVPAAPIRLNAITGTISIAANIPNGDVNIDLAVSNAITNPGGAGTQVAIVGVGVVNDDVAINSGTITGKIIQVAGGNRTMTGKITIENTNPNTANLNNKIIIFKNAPITWNAANNRTEIQINLNQGIISNSNQAGPVEVLRTWDENRQKLLKFLDKADRLLMSYIWENILNMVRDGGFYSTWVRTFQHICSAAGWAPPDNPRFDVDLVRRLEIDAQSEPDDPFQFHGTDAAEIIQSL